MFSWLLSKEDVEKCLMAILKYSEVPIMLWGVFFISFVSVREIRILEMHHAMFPPLGALGCC